MSNPDKVKSACDVISEFITSLTNSETKNDVVDSSSISLEDSKYVYTLKKQDTELYMYQSLFDIFKCYYMPINNMTTIQNDIRKLDFRFVYSRNNCSVINNFIRRYENTDVESTKILAHKLHTIYKSNCEYR